MSPFLEPHLCHLRGRPKGLNAAGMERRCGYETYFRGLVWAIQPAYQTFCSDPLEQTDPEEVPQAQRV